MYSLPCDIHQPCPAPCSSSLGAVLQIQRLEKLKKKQHSENYMNSTLSSSEYQETHYFFHIQYTWHYLKMNLLLGGWYWQTKDLSFPSSLWTLWLILHFAVVLLTLELLNWSAMFVQHHWVVTCLWSVCVRETKQRMLSKDSLEDSFATKRNEYGYFINLEPDPNWNQPTEPAPTTCHWCRSCFDGTTLFIDITVNFYCSSICLDLCLSIWWMEVPYWLFFLTLIWFLLTWEK